MSNCDRCDGHVEYSDRYTLYGTMVAKLCDKCRREFDRLDLPESGEMFVLRAKGEALTSAGRVGETAVVAGEYNRLSRARMKKINDWLDSGKKETTNEQE